MHRKTHNSFANSDQRNENSFRSNCVANSRINSSMNDCLQQAAPHSFSPIQYRANDHYRNHHSRTSSNYYQAPSVYQNQLFYPNSVPINYQGQTSNSNSEFKVVSFLFVLKFEVGKSTPESDPMLSFFLDYSSNQGLHSNYGKSSCCQPCCLISLVNMRFF